MAASGHHSEGKHASMRHPIRVGAAGIIGALLSGASWVSAAQEKTAAPQLPAATDPAAVAAHAAGEPSLQEILDRQGYTIHAVKDEINVQRFRKAGRGPVVYKPIAAYGLAQVCTGGWYPAPGPASQEKPERPDK